MVVYVCVMSQLDHPRMRNQVEWHREFQQKKYVFSRRCWDLNFTMSKKIVNIFLLFSQVFKKVTFLHLSGLLKILRPLNFYRRTPWGLTFPKNRKIIPVGGNRTCGQGIDCQDCDKNSRQLALFFEKMAAWMEFRLKKWFPVAEKLAQLWIRGNKTARDNCSNTPTSCMSLKDYKQNRGLKS